MAQKRKKDGPSDRCKKLCSAIDNVAENWICPITTELPLDPVMAEDGRVYERSAIEEHIRQNRGGVVKSPLTNLPMGPNLIPSLQARNTIEQLVRSEAISGDKAERWLERIKEEEKLKLLKLRAEGGEASAMAELGGMHFTGLNGVKEDEEEAYRWRKRAADKGHIESFEWAGFHLQLGIGVNRNTSYGMVMTALGAAQGDRAAAFVLAECFRTGKNESLPKDDAQAKFWYRKVASCKHGYLAPLKISQAAGYAACEGALPSHS